MDFRILLEKITSALRYVALFPEKKDVVFNKEWFGRLKNLFAEFMPQSVKYEGVIGVYDISDKELRIMSDVVSQKVICFSENGH